MVRYVPLGHTGLESGSQLELRAALRALAPLLAEAGIGKVGHDLKFDAIVLADTA